jgi:hypothetical protein
MLVQIALLLLLAWHVKCQLIWILKSASNCSHYIYG